jgi:hypothetical protein
MNDTSWTNADLVARVSGPERGLCHTRMGELQRWQETYGLDLVSAVQQLMFATDKTSLHLGRRYNLDEELFTSFVALGFSKLSTALPSPESFGIQGKTG